MQGVEVCGRRTTITRRDGSPGMTSENWFSSEDSPQLGAVLLLRTSGALVPNSTVTLTNLHYSEPDPSLFKVPDVYQIVDDQ
jgi:hypothetical protein